MTLKFCLRTASVHARVSFIYTHIETRVSPASRLRGDGESDLDNDGTVVRYFINCCVGRLRKKRRISSFTPIMAFEGRGKIRSSLRLFTTTRNIISAVQNIDTAVLRTNYAFHGRNGFQFDNRRCVEQRGLYVPDKYSTSKRFRLGKRVRNIVVREITFIILFREGVTERAIHDRFSVIIIISRNSRTRRPIDGYPLTVQHEYYFGLYTNLASRAKCTINICRTRRIIRESPDNMACVSVVSSRRNFSNYRFGIPAKKSRPTFRRTISCRFVGSSIPKRKTYFARVQIERADYCY